MQVVFRSLLAVTLAAWVASCALDEHGLGSKDVGLTSAGAAGHPAAGDGAGTAGASAGAAGTSVTGVAGDGAGGDAIIGSTGAAGDGADAAAGTGDAGTTGEGGDTGSSAGTTGAAGDTGAAGTGDAAGTSGGAGDGAAGTTGDAGTTGAAGTTGTAGAGGAAPEPGCSDGTREGYLDMSAYPNIAACSGAWDEPGLTSSASKVPRCDRRGGNSGDKPDGHGCSVADLCATGWRVCESAKAVAVASGGAGCADAIAPAADKPIFFITRQHASNLNCDNSSQPTGSNNLYGCGNFGSAASPSCSPFTKMLRDSDCNMYYPWECMDGTVGYATDEQDVVTKPSSGRGGVLCCRN